LRIRGAGASRGETAREQGTGRCLWRQLTTDSRSMRRLSQDTSHPWPRPTARR
jgi:hypothetical protein